MANNDRSLLEALYHGLHGSAGRVKVVAKLEDALLESTARPSLAGQWLRHAQLNDLNLAGVDFSGAQLQDADLSNSDLSGADFTGANLAGARLVGATLDPRQLLGAYGLVPGSSAHGIPLETWLEVLPNDLDALQLLDGLCTDWEDTLQEAIDAAEALRSA